VRSQVLSAIEELTGRLLTLRRSEPAPTPGTPLTTQIEQLMEQINFAHEAEQHAASKYTQNILSKI